ncbi:MAG: IS110 family transposase [Rhodococcus sp. (in: high G+C Gram-positive bacteria)]|uniref:IS110 family transposase n=1 Tax=Rhodococcus sp. TaxID=1831 RepID=UPI003BAF9FEC
MQTFAAVDLHSNNGFLTVIDETDRVLRQKKLPNRISAFVDELEPFRATLQGVAVESTFNWYWLVDGLIDHGFAPRLVNTSAIQQYEGLKHSDDPYDAWWLAHMMRLGILPTGHIYPREERAVRDLLRKRMRLVQQRTANILSVQNLEQRNRGTKLSSNEVKKLTAARVRELYTNDDLALSITTTLNVIHALTEQINVLERTVVKKAKLRPEFEPLRSVWGIGDVLSLTIMYEAGSMDRFASPGDFASYARCVDAKRLSNGKKKADNNGKNGNKYLAWAFVEAARFAVRFYPEAKRYYDKKAAKTNTIVATKAIAHKLARACFHVLRDRVPFDPKKVFV